MLYDIDHKLQMQERLTDDVNQVFQKSERLFDELFYAWQKDSGMQHFLMDQQDIFEDTKHRVFDELNEQRSALSNDPMNFTGGGF